MNDVGVDVFAEWGVVPEDVVALSHCIIPSHKTQELYGTQ